MDIFYTDPFDPQSENKEEEYIYSPKGKTQSRRRYILSLSKNTINMYKGTIVFSFLIKLIKDPWLTRRSRYHPCPPEYIDGMTVETYHSIIQVISIIKNDDRYSKEYLNDFKNFLKTHPFYGNFSFELHDE